jgi:hypothetical protein
MECASVLVSHPLALPPTLPHTLAHRGPRGLIGCARSRKVRSSKALLGLQRAEALEAQRGVCSCRDGWSNVHAYGRLPRRAPCGAAARTAKPPQTLDDSLARWPRRRCRGPDGRAQARRGGVGRQGWFGGERSQPVHGGVQQTPGRRAAGARTAAELPRRTSRVPLGPITLTSS